MTNLANTIRKLTNKRRSPANGSNTSSVGGVTSLILLTPLIAITIGSIIATEKVWATESTLSLSISNSNIAVNIAANGTSGTFVKSDASTITASTDNYTGYTLKIKAASSTNYTDLVNSTDSNAKITSIESITTEGIFKGSNNTDYNGKWGYAPSQYITYSNGVGTVVDNSGTNPNFLPAPDSETGLTLDETSAPNNTSPNEYTLAIGARVDTSQKMGEYSNTYNVIMVANAISYSIVYNDGVVSNMPTDTTGTSPTTSLTLSSDTPVRSGYEFIGWCDGTVTTTNNVDSCSGTTYAAGGTYTLDGTTTNNISLTAMWEKPKATIATATYLQEVEECPSTLTTGQVYSLKDSRDEQSYNVAKLADGKCWMITNLNLAGGTVLSSDKSDVPSTNYYTLPASSTSGFSDNTVAYVYNSGNTTSTCTSPGCYSYYSWIAATAGGKDSSGNAVSTSGYNTAYSICPKGWRLPTSTTSNASSQSNKNWKTGDWYALATAYGANLESNYSQSAATFYNNAGPGTTPNFLLAGNYSSGSFSNGGSRGYYWSSTSSSSSTSANGLSFYSGNVNLAGSNYRRDGRSVRCVYGS